MIRNPHHEIALFDLFQLNRKAVIKLLSADYDVTELDHWEAVEQSKAQTFIIMHPELLRKEQQQKVVDWLKEIDANVILIRHDLDYPWNRTFNRLRLKRNIKLLTKPNEARMFAQLQKYVTSNVERVFLCDYRQAV